MTKPLLNPELVYYCGSSLLECPCWDAENNIIYCVSIEQCMIYGINLVSGEIISFPTDGEVGCVVIDHDGMLLSAEKNGLYKTNPVTKERFYITQLETDKLMRYNDGKLDPQGRFLVGTKGYYEDRPGKGKLYSFDGKNFKTLINGITISNGIGFSSDGKKMYFIDTITRKIGLYAYNSRTGVANFERYIIELQGAGWPDGMAVDIDEMIWVAEWEGGKVCKWHPESGEKIVEVKIPCSRVTSCCIGGEDLNYLFVTTGQKKDEQMSGGLFKIKIR